MIDIYGILYMFYHAVAVRWNGIVFFEFDKLLSKHNNNGSLRLPVFFYEYYMGYI